MRHLLLILLISIHGCAERVDNGEEIRDLQSQIDELKNSFYDQPDYQALINELTVRVAELETHSPVIEIIDPCGDGVGFDEIIMRLNTGELIAYFQQGSHRFLASLPEGEYQTTDQSKCRFSVDSTGSIQDTNN